MVALALYCVTIALTLPNSEQESKPPVDIGIIWVFSEQSCLGCALSQLEFMQTWYREGDLVIIKCQSQAMKEITVRVLEHFPKAKSIDTKDGSHLHPTTGWIWFDRQTGEELIYNSMSGVYSPQIAKSLIKIVRDAS